LQATPKKSREGRPGAGALFLLAALVCTWSLSWPVMKAGIAAVPPLSFAFLRYLIAAIVLASVAGLTGRLRVPPRGDWPLVIISGTLQMAGFSALATVALTIVPAGRASVLAYSTPLWVVPLARFRLKERISLASGVGVAIGLAGIFVIAEPSIGRRSPGEAVGNALLLAAAAMWAVSIVCVRAHRFTATPFELAPWQMIIAALLLLPAATFLDPPIGAIDARGAAALAYVSLAATAFAYWAMVWVGQRLAASIVSMALLAVPCLGPLLSASILGETIGWPLIIGVLLILSGIALSTIRNLRIIRPQRPVEPSGDGG